MIKLAIYMHAPRKIFRIANSLASLFFPDLPINPSAEISAGSSAPAPPLTPQHLGVKNALKPCKDLMVSFPFLSAIP